MTAAREASRVRSLGPGLRRVRAPNPGPMTGAGTNTYLLGEAEIIVIDPGPAVSAHVEAILHHAPGPIRWILVTHTHLDHSPAARVLAERSGARLAGRAGPPGARQDASFTPDRTLEDGDRIAAGDCVLEAVLTPGHASNHVCYWQPRGRALFTGDHIIGGSTVVIDPPDGDMTDYLASLHRLDALGAATLMPGHGDPLHEPGAAIAALLAHRLRREAKVLDTLPRDRGSTLEELVPIVYADVDPGLHRVAARSLLAHLIKLERDGRAVRLTERWRRR